MSINHFGTHIAITHYLLEDTHDIMPGTAKYQDLSVELALWLNAKISEQKWRDAGTPDGTLNGPRSFLAQPKMRDLAERSLVAATRGFRPPLANQLGYLSSVGHALATNLEPVIDHLAQNSTSAWEPQVWTRADELFISAAIPVSVVRILNLFFVAVTRTERNFLTARQTNGSLDQFQIPGKTILKPENGNVIAQNQPTAQPVVKQTIPTFVPLPTSKLPGAQLDTTQYFDETNTYLMDEGSMWRAWVPVSIFQPATRNLTRMMYRLGLVDLRAFSTAGRGRPRLIVRTSTVGERLLRHLAAEKMLD